MPASKIQDEREVIRWFEEGRTYGWMVAEYRRKYGIETVPSMFGNFRGRRGLQRRIARDAELIPWSVENRHRNAYPLQMLRVEARVREGFPISASDRERLDSWRATLRREDVVVAYDPTAVDGFQYVSRLPEDSDLIRRPPRTTRQRPTVE
ncbi:hypothetical protein [Candidatus Blastococcus massiliensis]|uniref:hypothetical protein n=1 Tax=Candidatus Blastococcus massiliensis TaxID=1470358 RepID=UPI0004B630A6|nr:hypothetical protein [Candidatus Blastococcus massiliensis]